MDNNIPPTQTPNGIVVPPLQIPGRINNNLLRVDIGLNLIRSLEDWMAVVDEGHSQENHQTNHNIPPPPSPPQPSANRYHTVVSVEYIVLDNLHLIKWFSDIQMAWIWINGQVRERQGENWDIVPFLTTANAMDRRWTQGFGEDGFCVADSDGYEYIVYYEPTVNYDDVRDREEHF